MIPEPEQFAGLCYLVLMDHHGSGYTEAHPSYIGEKLSLLRSGYEAYGALDRENQNKVRMHLQKWGYGLPEEITEYETAYQEAMFRGL